MKIVKSSKAIQENMLNVVLLLGGILLIVGLYYYSANKSSFKDNMDVSTSLPKAPSHSVGNGSLIEAAGPSSQVGSTISESSASSVQLNNAKEIVNPADLLPVDRNNEWSNMNPPRDDLKNMNFLAPEQHIGINTVGNSLRNANLQIRSEPPNPQVPVGPFLNTTIEPDTTRRQLEIGNSSM